MKKIICIICAILCVLTISSCGNSGVDRSKTETDVLPTVLNTEEYTLYTNIFGNDYADQYANKETTKTGTFTILYDRYNEVDRYYVWGYNDNTKCCDWQWEFVPKDASKLPANGSLIDVTGTFVQSDNALDGYWIDNADVTVITKYNSKNPCYCEMTTMGGTLERVEIWSIQNKSDFFEGKTVSAYGRVYSPTSIQHPYYDDTFELEFTTGNSVPAIGTYVIITGVCKDGVITDATVEETNLY